MTQGFNPFAGMREAQTFGSGNYLDVGTYKVKIKKMIWQRLNKGGEALIVETEVLESDNPKHKVGSEATWFQKANESFKSEAKLFCYAATGYDDRNPEHQTAIKEKVEPNCEQIMLKGLTEGVLNGREVLVRVFAKPKKSKPDESFNKHVFKPAQPPMF